MSRPALAPGSAVDSGAAADDRRIRRIAILGGGTAGWLAASVLARALPGSGVGITVIESPDIGTVGVGEATIPPIIDLLRFLSINEADFIRHTQATFKLGIRFTDWQRIGHSYWHPFGTFGAAINHRPFHHSWLKARDDGELLRFNDYSLSAALADAGKFRFPDSTAAGPEAGLRYALHFDAALVAQYLAAYSGRLGVLRREATLARAPLRADGGIDELIFTDGSRLQADLYLDCSGFRGVLIEQALATGYLDWSDVLPCDRAVAVQTQAPGPRPPYTQATAHGAGWRWRIPLQNRTGNGYVYSSAHVSDAAALDELLRHISGKTLTEPRVLKFVTGRRKLFWNRNCIALGLASGFLEPLESTSIHLIVSGLYRLLDHFPDRTFAEVNIDAYNAEAIREFEQIRDFIILHYCLTQRDDSPLWAHCQTMKIPASLAQRIELYRGTGRVRPQAGELFTDLSWFYIFEGMGVRPDSHDPLMDTVTKQQLSEILAGMARATRAAVDGAPSHDSHFAMTSPVPGAKSPGAVMP